MLDTDITYRKVCVSTYLSADTCDYLETGDKKLYFEKLPNAENAILIMF